MSYIVTYTDNPGGCTIHSLHSTREAAVREIEHTVGAKLLGNFWRKDDYDYFIEKHTENSAAGEEGETNG